jgi:hypothetical protein
MKLAKRLNYLYTGEMASFILFIPFSWMLNCLFPHLKLFRLCSFWISFILLEFILLQGTIYWGGKLKRIRNNEIPVPLAIVKQSIRRFKLFKVINMVILGAGILAFGIDLVRWDLDSAVTSAGLFVAMGIYAFALLEFINYFYIQLAYDNLADIRNLFNNGRLKPSCINKEIKRSIEIEE